MYLGADLPASELVRAVQETRASTLALGITHQRGEPLREFFEELERELDPETELWVGGARCAEWASDRIRPIPDLKALEERILIMTRDTS